MQRTQGGRPESSPSPEPTIRALARTFPLPISRDHFEAELTVALRRDHEPAAQVRRIGLVVALAAEGHQLLQVEVGAAPCAFDHVVDVQAPPHTAGLAAPAGASQNPLSDRGPLGPTGRLTTLGPRASRSHASTRAHAERRSSSQHGVVARFLPAWANVGALIGKGVFMAFTGNAYSASCLDFPFR